MSAATKDRILDSAERLFAERGFDATSIRNISADAGVNLAAVNYHFQSKEVLLEAVYARRAGPVNDKRMALLDRFEAEANGKPVPLERILEALFRPILELGDGAGHIPRMMVRMQYGEQESVTEQIFESQFRPLFARMFAALRRTLPGLPEEELFWRIQLALGAFSHVVAGGSLMRIAARGKLKKQNPEMMMKRLIQFASAGFRS